VRAPDECERQAGLLLLIGVAAGWADDRGPLTRAGALLASAGTRTVVQQLGALEPSAAFARAAVWTWP
jgi:hypothetical protein